MHVHIPTLVQQGDAFAGERMGAAEAARGQLAGVSELCRQRAGRAEGILPLGSNPAQASCVLMHLGFPL